MFFRFKICLKCILLKSKAKPRDKILEELDSSNSSLSSTKCETAKNSTPIESQASVNSDKTEILENDIFDDESETGESTTISKRIEEKEKSSHKKPNKLHKIRDIIRKNRNRSTNELRSNHSQSSIKISKHSNKKVEKLII